MPSVPRYSDQKVAPTNIPGVRISDSGASPAAFGAGIGAGLADVGKVVNQFAQVEQEKADTAALMEAQKRMSQIDLDLLNDPEKGAFATKGKDAIGIHERILPEWDKRASEVVSTAPARVQAKLQEYQMRRRESATEGMMRHALQQGDRYYQEEAESTMKLFQSEAITNRLDPAAVDRAADQAMQAAQVAAQRAGLSSDGTKLFVRAAASTAYRGALEALIDDDPAVAESRFEQSRKFMSGEDEAAVNAKLRPLANLKADEAAYDVIKSGGVPVGGVTPVPGFSTFEASVADVFRTEGGYVSNDGGKGETNLGINTTANPGIDIKGMTKAKAAAIYKERYWDAIGADDLPDAIRGIAFDAAVNQGPAKAKEWAKESGGDIGKYMELRKAHYAALIKANPGKYAQYEKGWKARVEKFGRTTGGTVAQGERADPPKTEAEAMQRIDDLYANDPTRRERVRKVAARDWQMRDAQSEQLDRDMAESMYQAAYAADPHAPPEKAFTAAHREWAIKNGHMGTFEGILDRRAKGEEQKSDQKLLRALEVEAQRSPETFVNRNIYSLLPRLSHEDGMRIVDHHKALRDPAKRGKAQADWASESQRIATGLRLLGYDKLTGDDATVKSAEFGAAYRLAEQAFIQDNGKAPVGKQADELVRQTVHQFLTDPNQGRKVRAAEKFGLDVSRQLQPGDRAEVIADFRAKGKEPTEADIQRVLSKFYSGAPGG